jgi:threonine dehydrogenase-like Zn-dependent dehydrogenase
MNPWQEIPLADYETHMQSEAVGQAVALSELFGEVLAQRKPASVAVLGVAGGNGLERIDQERTRRVVGVDLNPQYLATVRKRFGEMTGLELYEVDLAEEPLALAPVELVHGALVFEHAGLGRCLENALALIMPEGALSVVLQLPGAESQNVGNSGVASIGKLSSHFKLVDPAALTRTLTERGLRLIREEKRSLPAGKKLWLGVFTWG